MNFFRNLLQLEKRKNYDPDYAPEKPKRLGDMAQKSISIGDIYNNGTSSGVQDGQLGVSVMGANLAYMHVPEVMSAVDIISESAAIVPMVIKDQNGNEIARSDKNPDKSRLITAIQNSTRVWGVPLVELMCKSDLLWGMTFVEPTIDSFKWLNTTDIQIVAPLSKIEGYLYQPRSSKQTRFSPKELIYIRQFHPNDDIYGWSKTFNIMSKANMTLDFDRFTISYYRNGGFPGMMVQFKDKGNLSDAQALATMWRQTFRGVDNFFKTHVSHIPLDVSTLDPIDISKPLEVANKSGLDILKVYHVPPELIGDTSSNAYQFSAEKKNTFMQTVVQPATMDIEQTFNRPEIIRHYEPEGYTFHFDYSEFQNITENDKARQQMARENFQAGGMEYNDYLTTIGQKPNPLFAGMYYVQGINAPMPASEIVNLWRTQVSAPRVFTMTESTDRPLLQSAIPDKVISVSHNTVTDIEQLGTPTDKHQHNVIDHAIANTTNKQWSKGNARKELVSWLRRYRKGQAKNIKADFMRGDFADEIQAAIKKNADVEGAFDDAFNFLNGSINLLEATFTTILLGTYHEPSKNIHAILNPDTGILEYTDIGYRFDKASVFKSVQAVRLDFEDRFEDVLVEIRLGNISDRRRAGNILRQIGTIFINRAFRQGLEDGGVMSNPNEDEKAEIKTLVSTMSGHISNLTKVLIKEGGITDAQAAGKIGQWWNKSILPAYYAGFNSAAGNQMMEFTGSDGKKSCATCQRLNGQRHRMKDWTRKQLRPQVDTQSYICGGWECNHQLTPIVGKARGGF